MKGSSFACVLLFAMWSTRGEAQQSTDMARAKESFNAGATAYAMGEYLAAIQALDAAYATTPLPAIAFSLAQAERRQYFVDHDRSHLDRAIALFRKYLEEVASGGRRSDAVDAIAQLEPLAAKSITPEAASAPPAAAVRPTRLIVTSDADGALVSVDGGPSTASPWIGEVEPGQHRVKVAAQGFYETEREVMAVAGELIPAAVPLRERPSTVAVWAAPDAGLYLDGRFVRQGGEGVVLTVASGAHRVDVAEKGHVVSSHDLELGRGENRDLHVFLAPTSQRRAAQALFLAGAASLATGVVFGALALHAESAAQDFLDKQAHQNVSSDELSSYHSHLTDRGRYRAGAMIGMGAGAGLFLTGLFLYELDQPRVQEPKLVGPAASGARLLGPLSVAPLLVQGGGGAILSF
jgi:tetratricopeptide (TPR) repeat protein